MSEPERCPHCGAPVAVCARCHERGGVVGLDDAGEPVICPDCGGDFINYAPPALPPDVREALRDALRIIGAQQSLLYAYGAGGGFIGCAIDDLRDKEGVIARIRAWPAQQEADHE